MCSTAVEEEQRPSDNDMAIPTQVTPSSEGFPDVEQHERCGGVVNDEHGQEDAPEIVQTLSQSRWLAFWRKKERSDV